MVVFRFETSTKVTILKWVHDSVRSISHLSRSTSFTQVSRSRLRPSVRDFALFVSVTVVENDLNFREVGVRLFTILRGFLWKDDTFSHLIDVWWRVAQEETVDGSPHQFWSAPKLTRNKDAACNPRPRPDHAREHRMSRRRSSGRCHARHRSS